MAKKNQPKIHPTCYMCEKPSTSREHVPPRCFFPDKGEFPIAGDLRRNLITIPSCNKHNLEKSGDDQYLCTVVAIHFENNPIAQAHFHFKIMRSLKRKPRMIPGFFGNLMPALVMGSQSAAFTIDRPRFDRAIDQIARGIYFHHFHVKYTGLSKIMSYSLFDVTGAQRNEINAAQLEWRRYSDAILVNAPRFGENPSVFYYQTINDFETKRVAIHIVFYEGFVADVFLREVQPSSSDDL